MYKHLPLYMYMCHVCKCPAKASVGFPGTRVMDDCDQPFGF